MNRNKIFKTMTLLLVLVPASLVSAKESMCHQILNRANKVCDTSTLDNESWVFLNVPAPRQSLGSKPEILAKVNQSEKDLQLQVKKVISTLAQLDKAEKSENINKKSKCRLYAQKYIDQNIGMAMIAIVCKANYDLCVSECGAIDSEFCNDPGIKSGELKRNREAIDNVFLAISDGLYENCLFPKSKKTDTLEAEDKPSPRKINQ